MNDYQVEDFILKRKLKKYCMIKNIIYLISRGPNSIDQIVNNSAFNLQNNIERDIIKIILMNTQLIN